MVATVEPDSPAERAGLKAGDIITGLDGIKITGADDFVRVLDGEKIGRTVAMEMFRGGSLQTVAVIPEERPKRG